MASWQAIINFDCMAITKDIKRRIKSIISTKKVTKAMEMVSAAKMRKAVSNVLASRSYSVLAWELVKNLAARTNSKYHPLLKKRKIIKKIGLVLVTSNRGLCGGFNSQIIQKTLQYIRNQRSEKQAEVELVVLGKKGRDFMIKHNQSLIAEFEKLDITTNIAEIRPITKLLIEDYIAGKFDKVVFAYTDFISTLIQKPRILEILPIIQEGEQDGYLGKVRQENNLRPEAEKKLLANFIYKFEPSPDKVLSELLPRLLEMQIYQAILESDAAEHSARMVAMRNAADAATDMISDLTLAFNKVRQSSITAELADISGGRIAME